MKDNYRSTLTTLVTVLHTQTLTPRVQDSKHLRTSSPDRVISLASLFRSLPISLPHFILLFIFFSLHNSLLLLPLPCHHNTPPPPTKTQSGVTVGKIPTTLIITIFITKSTGTNISNNDRQKNQNTSS